MDGEEKKAGGKRRGKRFEVEVDLDSDDDEPIGSLLRLRPKNPKKVKVVEAREEKLEAEDEIFGGMEDTLASFRKKLKGPKRDIVSVIVKGLEASVERACIADDGSLDAGLFEETERKVKGRARKGKINVKREMNDGKGDATADDDVDAMISHGALLQGGKEENLNPQECLDHTADGILEDSLPVVVQKVQFSSQRKHDMTSRLKEKCAAQILEDGITATTISTSGISKSAPSLRMESLSIVACKDVKDEDGSDVVTSFNPIGLASEQNTTLKSQRLHNSSWEGPIRLEENSSAVEEVNSLTRIGDDSMRSKMQRCGESPAVVSEAPASSSLSSSLHKWNNEEPMSDSHLFNVKEESTDHCTSHRVCDQSFTALGQQDFLDCQNAKNGLSHSIGAASKMANDEPSKMGRDETLKQEKERILDISLKSLSLKMDGAARTENGLDFGQCLNASKHVQPHSSDSAFASLKVEKTSSDGASLHSPGEEPGMTVMSNGVHESEFASQVNHIGSRPGSCAYPNGFSASVKKCSSVFKQKQLDDVASDGSYVPSHDSASINEEADGAFPVTPEENESYQEDAVSGSDSGSNDGNLSAVQRAARKARKRRLEDMAYEGDEDWGILINEQFLESDQAVDGDQSFRMREKSDSSLTSAMEAEKGGAVAVSVGLKARAAGPVEKIKFKEVLKRKGGLQEYLECRNKILGLWGKDLSRILPLADCGMADTPSEDETPRASLIREIYAFLDHNGYINFGVASDKEKAQSNAKHDYAPVEEKSFRQDQLSLVAQLEDGVSLHVSQAKSSEASLESKNGVALADGNVASKCVKSSEAAAPVTLESSNIMGHEETLDDKVPKSGTTNTTPPIGQLILEYCSANPSHATIENRSSSAPALDSRGESQMAHPCSCSGVGISHDFQCDSRDGKNIIVIGAGPAGLTAARHLQRQGFSITVLEARSRIGGRVFTDCSSLSVPVDLGASIITGVEADVATERRPDPSALVCAQLGLEFTVLNSDCPLYDIVMGEKVPADLDEALEEEYNSLLDDMVLLVAQKGEHVMKMSLEDGLEYALNRRRMARLGTDGHGELNSAVDLAHDSKTCGEDCGVPVTGCSKELILSPLERRVMDWHYAHLEYGCAALLKEVSLPYWNQDDVYGGFGGAHCMIKGGYSSVIESLGEGLDIHLNQVVTEISYGTKESGESKNCSNVKVSASNGCEFFGDAVLVTVPLGCLKAETIKFCPPLPQWKNSSIQRLGFGVLNKVVLEFPEVFWDDSVDYFGATSEETDRRGHCFMFWNVKKTVRAPVLIALVVGKAAIEGQTLSSSDHVRHALLVLRKIFGEASVPEPVASVVTDWGRDPFSYGAYSYVAIGSSGEDYDILGQPVGNSVFFAGEATCKEHPDTVGGAMMSGLREAVRMINILNTGHDCTAEVEAMEAAERHSECERDEVRDITKRLEAVDLSNALYKSSLEGERILTKECLLQEMFFTTKTTAGRLHLAKKLLNLPVETLKSFAGTIKGLSTLNSWILDSLGKDATQLLRHCVRLLVLVSTNLLAVRLSGIGKTVKEKVCVHTSRDIRAIASQLVNVWLRVFRREKALNGRLQLSKQATNVESLKKKPFSSLVSGKPPLSAHHGPLESKGSLQVHEPMRSSAPFISSMKKVNGKLIKVETSKNSKLELVSCTSLSRMDPESERKDNLAMSQEEQAAIAAAEAASAAACAAAEAYALSEAKHRALLQLPKIPSFNKFARREQYAQMDEYDYRKKWSGGVLGRQDCLSEIDSRNCRVRDWSVDFSATCANLDGTRMSADNLSQWSHSNEIASHMNFREQSGESAAADSSLFTKAWLDTAGSVGIKDYHAIVRWQSQAAAADFSFAHPATHVKDEEDSNTSSKQLTQKNDGQVNGSSISQVTVNKEHHRNHSRGADRIKQAVVDFVTSLLMPVYKARKIDRDGYKSIMKKCATKVMEQATDAEKAMSVSEFLDLKRKNKIRDFVDKLIERHMATKPTTMS